MERHPELYFSTGDVVLQAPFPSTEDGEARYQLYRVHKVILGLHSVAFSDLFADASAGLGLTYDGLPMVEMPDKADDLSCLLDCIYNPSHFLSKRPRYNTASDLRGVVRLADKYVLENLRAELIRKVSEDWPSELLEWDVRDAELEAMTTAILFSSTVERGRRLMDCLPEPGSAIMFAEEFGCREILPAAFYFLARVNIESDWEKRRHSSDSGSCTPTLYARWSDLDGKNLLRYVRGCKRLEEFHSTMSIRIANGTMLSTPCIPSWTSNAFDPSRPRDEPYPCLRFIKKLRQEVWTEYHVLDPLRGLQELSNHIPLSWISTTTLCRPCHLEFHRWIQNERESFWNTLPQIFQLEAPGQPAGA